MRRKAPPTRARRYALCIDAGKYENVDLVQRKVYEVRPDADAERHGQIRVVDESGEDYLFPAEYFQLLTLPASAAYGRAELYVTERTPLGFVVNLKDGDPNAEFSYRIAAKRLGFEEKRLDAAPWADRLSGGEGESR